MAYNFKSIADVEVVAEPTESANVLIEENGVIKKAPKTAVGGANEKYDAIISREYRDSDGDVHVNLISGNYENIRSKIESGEMPNILAKEVEIYDTLTCISTSKAEDVVLYSYEDSEYIYIDTWDWYCTLYPDGTIEW